MHPTHWKYLGFGFDGTLYVYCVLPFGLNASAGIFCRFSAVAARAIIAECGTAVLALIVYIDDFGIALSDSATLADAERFIAVIESLGFSVN